MVDSNAKPKRRVRTGCSTCREKKIKCDEVHKRDFTDQTAATLTVRQRKPTCKNCDKPGRVCRYELSKRDHHNPTVQTTDLPKYFNGDDRPDYSAEQLASFRPVPDLITWTTPRTLNNFDDEIFYEADATPTEASATMARAQQTATDGLQALSAAAANYTAQAMATYSGSTSANVIDPSLDSRRLSPSPVEGVERQDSRGVKARVKAESDAADAQLAQALLEAQQEETVAVRRTIDEP